MYLRLQLSVETQSTRLPPTTPDLKIISFKPKSMSCNKYHTISQVSTRKICRCFFITTVPPYKQCSKDTIARWIKETFSLANINSGIYQAHSLRSASTSSASYKGVNLRTILKSANWTRNSTFKKYYKKEIDQLYCDFRGKNEFANSLLSSFQ